MEPATRRILIFFSFLFFSLSIDAQSTLTLHDALIEISKQHQLNLIFNPDQVNNKSVNAPNKEWSIEKQLSSILEHTNLQFKVEDRQIFIFIKHKIYGYLEDAETGERLISATILSVKDGQYDVSNESGYFTISTIDESLDIEVSYIGYATLKKTIGSHEMDSPITLGLTYDNSVEEIVISDALVSNDERSYIELNKGTDILLRQNQASSAIGGEPDIFQAMIRQSGVNSGPDGIGGIHIRGGKNDQNQILYDGVRLYNSSHAFGVYSIINSNIIDQARLHKSGASGSYSGRLSSVMDVRIKDPNLNSVNANIQVSSIASQAKLELPILKNKLGLMISGRRTHIDPFVKSLTRKSKKRNGEVGESNFYFDDFSLKLLGKIGKNQRLYLSMYRATDNYVDEFLTEFEDFGEVLFSVKENSLINWRNQLASLRYNILLGPNTFANVQLSAYKYDFKNDFSYNVEDFIDPEPYYYRDIVEFDSGITTYDFKVDLQTNKNDHEIKYGIMIGHKDYQGGVLAINDTSEDTSIPIEEPIELTESQLGLYDAKEATLYLTDKYKLSKSIMLESGIYTTYFNSVEYYLEEELSASYTNVFGYLKSLFIVSNHMNFGGSIGTYIQNEHLLTVGDNGYPSDIWLPSTAGTPPERSYQAEVFGEFSHKNHSLKVATYYKKQLGLVVLNFSESLPSITNLETTFWEEDTFLADAKSVGIELDYTFLLKDRFTFRTIYTGSYTDYYYEEEFIYPFEYSIPHTINIAINSKLSDRFSLSLDWYYASGRPHTLYSIDKHFSPIERTESAAIINQISESYNDSRLPNTHKLSASISTYWHWGKTKNNLTLGIQNLYNQKNLLYTYVYDDEYNPIENRNQQSFPLMPLIKWRVEI
jgi:outer membrane receptor protein involved in Fe transport